MNKDKKNDEIEIVTDVTKIKKKNKPKKPAKGTKPKIVGKHTLAYDNIHNSKIDTTILEENYIIPDLSDGFKVSVEIDSTHNYNSAEYYRSNELKKKVYDLLNTRTKLDFSPDVKRRIPSVVDLDIYYTMLMDELIKFNYSHLEVFIVLSEFFTDNIYNVYKKLNKKYKKAIYSNLCQKHKIPDIDEMNFL